MLPDSAAELPILITRDQLDARVRELGAEIRDTCGPEPLLCIGMLRGAVFFLVDLLRAVANDHAQIDFLTVRSYAGTESTGRLTIIGETPNVVGKRVLLVDDIVDTGNTLKAVSAMLREAGAAELWSAVMVDKPSRRKVEYEADFVGFKIEDKFVVGYGMDCDDRFRSCQDIRYVTT